MRYLFILLISTQLFASTIKDNDISFNFTTAQGSVLKSKNNQELMSPASIQKLITTGLILEEQGPDFKFKTTFYLEKTNGEFNKLLIQGDWDPSLGSFRYPNETDQFTLFKYIRHQLKLNKVTSLANGITALVKSPPHKTIPHHWNWGDIGNYYATGTNSINYHENLFMIYFTPGESIGDAVKIHHTSPHLDNELFINNVTTGNKNSGDQVYIYGGRGMTQRHITGTIPLASKQFLLTGSLPQLALQFINDLTRYLTTNNISIGKDKNNVQSDSITSLTKSFEYASPSLQKLVTSTNFKSINLYAEAFYQYIKSTPKKESQLGSFVERSFPLSLDQKDGSGLSAANKMSTQFMTRFLNKVSQSKSALSFWSSIPHKGSGTIKYKFKKLDSSAKIQAKSGSMGGVLSYAGRFFSKKGVEIHFCIILNSQVATQRDMQKYIDERITSIYNEN